MHIKTKETFPNMLRNCRFTFFTFIKKNGVEVRFETNTNFDNAVKRTDSLPTELIRSTLSGGNVYITLMISSVKHGSVKAYALTK